MKTNKPSCSDEMLNLYTLPQGLLMATWKVTVQSLECQNQNSNNNDNKYLKRVTHLAKQIELQTV